MIQSCNIEYLSLSDLVLIFSHGSSMAPVCPPTIATTFVEIIHSPQMINSDDFGDPLTLPLVLP